MDYEAYWAARLKRVPDNDERKLDEYKRRLIASLVEPNATALDIGCGDGGLLAYLRNVRSIRPLGMDISGLSCELARQKGIEVIHADASDESIPIPSVDYIILSEILEHLPNPEVLLARVRGKFAKRLLIDIPNTGALNDRLRLLLGRFPKQWVFHPSEHVRFWTVADFCFLCKQLGYDVERYYGLYDPYYWLGLDLWRLYPKLFSRYVLYVLR